GLAEDRHHFRSGREQSLQVGIGVGGYAGAAGTAEGDRFGVRQGKITHPLEKLHVLRIRSRKATLYIVNAHPVEALGNEELVFDAQRDTFSLSSVAQGGIVQLYHLGITSLPYTLYGEKAVHTYTQPFGRWPYCLGLYATRVQITSTSLPPDGSPVVEHLVNRLQISLRACLDHIRRSAPARVQVAVVFNPDGHLAERVLSARDGLQGIAFQIHRKARHPVDGMVHGVDRAFTARGLLHDLLPAPDAYRSRRERAVAG